jgi:hypothetical protein
MGSIKVHFTKPIEQLNKATFVVITEDRIDSEAFAKELVLSIVEKGAFYYGNNTYHFIPAKYVEHCEFKEVQGKIFV